MNDKFQIGDLVEICVTLIDDVRHIVAEKGSLGIVIGIESMGGTKLSYLIHFSDGQQISIRSALLKKSSK